MAPIGLGRHRVAARSLRRLHHRLHLGQQLDEGARGRHVRRPGGYGLGSTAPPKSLDAGAAYLHYLHGVNPLGKVYLSNMARIGAENSVDQFFHSWFADGSARGTASATRTYGPPPGFLVGGPNTSSTTGTIAARASRRLRRGLAGAACRAAAQKSYQRFQHQLAAEFVVGHRELQRLPDELHPAAGAVRDRGAGVAAARRGQRADLACTTTPAAPHQKGGPYRRNKMER